MEKKQTSGTNREQLVRELKPFLCRLEKGDEAARAQLRAIYDADPQLWQSLGNLASDAEGSMVELAARDPLSKEAVQRKIEAMKRDLEGPAPTPLVRLLAERVALCWLEVHYVDQIFAQRIKNELSLNLANFYQNWKDRAHRRYLSAIRTLAQVRRLEAPALQANIGSRQVNVAHMKQPGRNGQPQEDTHEAKR